MYRAIVLLKVSRRGERCRRPPVFNSVCIIIIREFKNSKFNCAPIQFSLFTFDWLLMRFLKTG